MNQERSAAALMYLLEQSRKENADLQKYVNTLEKQLHAYRAMLGNGKELQLPPETADSIPVSPRKEQSILKIYFF